MITIGKEESYADLIVPTGVLDFSVQNKRRQKEVDATLVDDDPPDLEEPDEFLVQSYEVAQSPNSHYHVCTLERHNVVLLFKNSEFLFKKDVVDPQTPNVTNGGTVIVTGYTDGGYKEGEHFLYVWDDTGGTIFTTEFRAAADLVRVSNDARFIACHTSDVLYKHSGTHDFTVYIIDLESESIRASYTDQIPGVSGGGGGGLQIREMRFVYDGTDPLLALFDGEQPAVSSNEILTPADLPAGTPLIDMDGNITEFGQPNINNYPGHYSLTKEGQKRLDDN